MTSRLHRPIIERRPMRARSAARAARKASSRMDVAAHKVREAGGPIDVASYVCLCGFVFAAAVSTSVKCPHCGAPQAW
jgi:rubrerythrin